MLLRMQAGVAAVWEEEVLVDQPAEHVFQDKVLFIFELVDFQVSP